MKEMHYNLKVFEKHSENATFQMHGLYIYAQFISTFITMFIKFPALLLSLLPQHVNKAVKYVPIKNTID